MRSQSSKRKLVVGLLFGGRSAEHEVSIVSAASVLKALDPKKYAVVPIGITKKGEWISSPDGISRLVAKRLPKRLKKALIPTPGGNQLISLSQASNGPKSGSQTLDIVIPILHGPFGEDGTIQGLLELADIPYVGSGVMASAVGMDKIIMKDIFRARKIPTANSVGLRYADWKKGSERVLRKVEKAIGYPCFTKPANLGSSVGISKCLNRAELKRGVVKAFRHDRKVIIEQNVTGREIECAVLGNDAPKASLPGEVHPPDGFYDYRAKYVDDSSALDIPANMPDALKKKVQDMAIKAFIALDCAGMARVDMFVRTNGAILVNELNTIPGFTGHISMYPKLWAASGLPFPKLLDELIKLAMERHAEKQRYLRRKTTDQTWHRT